MPFNDPSAGGDKLPLDQLVGALLLVEVREQTGEIQTTFGPATAIRADVHVLDGARKGERYDDTLIFPRKLQSQLRGSIGGMVIGRLGKGTAKAGQSPPWQLDAASEADKAIGERYLAHVQMQSASVEEPF
jgi:hypothetical protein